jgi:hypothetical protein
MFCLTLGAESAEPRSMDCNLWNHGQNKSFFP